MTLTDRKASRRERSAVDALRRKLNVSYALLGDRLGKPYSWVWERTSDRSLARNVSSAELAEIRDMLKLMQSERNGEKASA